MGVAALAALFAVLALGPWGNLLFRETIGIGLVGGVLFSLWKDRKDIRRRAAAQDPEALVYLVALVVFAGVGALSLSAGARDIALLTG